MGAVKVAAATKALELDDKLAEAYASLGLIAANYDWDWASAERNYRRAIGLNPNYVSAHQWYGQYLAMMGRHEESIEQLRRAREIDPLSPVNETFTGQALYFARRYDEAASQFRRAEELDANFFFTHLLLGWTQLQRRQNDEAIVEIQKARQLNDSPFVVAALGHAYAVAGRREEAMKTLDELTASSARDYVSPYYSALIYTGLRDKDRAFASLKQAYEERAVLLQWLKVDPIFDDLRSDPRFQELLQRVGFMP